MRVELTRVLEELTLVWTRERLPGQDQSDLLAAVGKLLQGSRSLVRIRQPKHAIFRGVPLDELSLHAFESAPIALDSQKDGKARHPVTLTRDEQRSGDALAMVRIDDSQTRAWR